MSSTLPTCLARTSKTGNFGMFRQNEHLFFSPMSGKVEIQRRTMWSTQCRRSWRSSHGTLNVIAHICKNRALFWLTCVSWTVSSHLATFQRLTSSPAAPLQTAACRPSLPFNVSVPGDFIQTPPLSDWYVLRFDFFSSLSIFNLHKCSFYTCLTLRQPRPGHTGRSEVTGQ